MRSKRSKSLPYGQRKTSGLAALRQKHFESIAGELLNRHLGNIDKPLKQARASDNAILQMTGESRLPLAPA